jgi:Ca2+-binding EF-hand superfamily protein/sporulation protein YlmC with PRC-barrel domain
MRRSTSVIAAALTLALAGAPAGAQQGANGSPGSEPGSAGQLMQHRAGELSGRAVTNENGEKLGRVDKLARRLSDGAVVAIVSTGGFLGFGRKTVVVPVDELSLQAGGQELAIAGVMTSDELEQMAPYTSTEYEPIEDSTRLAEAAGPQEQDAAQEEPGADGQTQAAARRSFEELDTDRDGRISRQEARSLRSLDRQWQSLDTDRDGQLNRSEFSAFMPAKDEPSSGAGASGAAIEDSFYDIDANQDGFIDPDEAQSHRDVVQHWNLLDKDGDGEISRAEFEAFPQRASGEPKPGP